MSTPDLGRRAVTGKRTKEQALEKAKQIARAEKGEVEMMITRVRLTAAEPIDLGYGLVAQAGTYDGERRVSGQQINSSHKLDQYFILRIGNNSNIDVTKFVNDGQLTVT